jgi:hypothetical protein
LLAHSTATTALSTSIDTLTANVGDNYVTSTDLNATYATTDGVAAIRQVALDVDGNITGWTATNGTSGSAFLIQADNFAITNQTQTSVPFSIDTTTGQAVFNGSVAFSNVTGTEEIPTMDEVDTAIVNDVTVIDGGRIVTSTLELHDQNLSGLLNVYGADGSIGWGKTGPNDFTNTGLFIGNSGGNPVMNFGSSERYFYYDGGNDILYFTGQTATGPATIGASSEYTDGINIRYDIPASVTSIKIELSGGGGGGRGRDNAYTFPFNDLWDVTIGDAIDGGDGGDTVARIYSASGVLRDTITAPGGIGGNSLAGYEGFANGGDKALADGDSFGELDPLINYPTDIDGYIIPDTIFYGAGGGAWNYFALYDAWTGVSERPATTGRYNSAGGGGGGYRRQDPGIDLDETTYYYEEGGDAGKYWEEGVYVVVSTGDYIIFDIGAGGIGGGTGNGTTYVSAFNTAKQRDGYGGASGTSGAVRIEILTTS